MKPLDNDPTPWWRYRIMWLVVGGPVVVVVAAIATMAIAVRGADVPLHVSSGASQAHAANPPAQRPATQPVAEP
ncbi:MAG: hypothetical protein OEM00_02980 [Burkholderiaceae bacterium]|nr:hypothetical protein [Burkholderiaceae bacterium]MDH3459938.1 hypothetical protein [Burkholderiaceae bacterium]